MTERELSAAELLALHDFKLDDYEYVRNSVPAGEHLIDVKISLQGALKVGEDYGAHNPVRCPTMLAVLMLILDTQGDEALPLQNLIKLNLSKWMAKAHQTSSNKAEAILAAFGIIQAEALYTERVKNAIGKQPRKGQVIATLVPESLD